MGLAARIVAGVLAKPAEALPIEELAMATGDSATVPNFDFASPCYLDEVWAQFAEKLGLVRIRSSRLHDDAQGIRLQVPVNNELLLPDGADQLLYPGDTLTLEAQAQVKEKAVVVALQQYFSDLPGVAARLAMWAEIQPRIKNIFGCQITEVTTTAVNWGAGKALNASFDTFKSGTDYAVLGYTSSIEATALRIVGPDTGNLGIGGPLRLDSKVTRGYFIDQSVKTGRPYIPIIASNNKAATLVSAIAPTEVKPNVTLILAELGA